MTKPETIRRDLIAMEREYTQELLGRTILGEADRLEFQSIVEILLQRRHLTFAFTPTCEHFLSSLRDKRAQRIVAGIILEEFGLPIEMVYEAEVGVRHDSKGTEAPGLGIKVVEGPLTMRSHRCDFVDELDKVLGIPRSEIFETEPTAMTSQSIADLANEIRELSRAQDLNQLVFLRYYGEVLTGREFLRLFKRLEKIGYLTRENSIFLWKHVDYDMLSVDGRPSHADRYLPLIIEYVQSGGKWQDVEQVLKRATELKAGFYQQFNS